MREWPLIFASVIVVVFSSCDHLKKSSEFSASDLENRRQPAYDESLTVCVSSQPTCCTPMVELRMLSLASANIKDKYDYRLSSIKRNIDRFHHAFDQSYQEMISSSGDQLHKMFTLTYGQFYASHAEVFSTFYRNLRDYFTKKYEYTLTGILDEFFFNVFIKMFAMLNPMEKVLDKHHDCIRRTLPLLQPFGDVPKKLELQLQRSLGTARSFTSALRAIARILYSLEKKGVSEDCGPAAAQLNYCSLCSSQLKTRPCTGFCINSMQQCFSEFTELDQPWITLIELLKKLAERLQGPYNVASVVIPVAVQISSGIMLYQENHTAVSSRIVQRCMSKRFTEVRLKREARRATVPEFSELSETRSKQLTSTMDAFLDKLRNMEHFWTSLPAMICSDFGSVSPANGSCWNGTDRYTIKPTPMEEKQRVANSEHFKNYIFESNVSDEKLRLKMLARRLSEVYNGKWPSNDSPETQDGSGYVPDYLPVDDEPGDGPSGMDDEPIEVPGQIYRKSTTEAAPEQKKAASDKAAGAVSNRLSSCLAITLLTYFLFFVRLR